MTGRSSRRARALLHNAAAMTAPLLHRPAGAPRHARRAAGAIALLVGLTLAWLFAGSVRAQGHLELRVALAAAGDAAVFPVDAPTRLVELPDEWSRSRPGAGGPVWYRVAFDAQGVESSGDLFALYIERVCSTLEVQLNGRRVHVAGRLDEPVTRNCQFPQLVTLPAALLRAGGNTIDIKVVGDPLHQVASRQRAGALSALAIGRHAELAPMHARAHALNVTLPQMASAVLLLLGGFMVIMGGLNRVYSHLAYYGALAVGWAVFTARLWCNDLPLASYDTELLLVSFMPFVTLAAVQFLLRYAGRRWRAVDAALYAQCVLVPLTLVLAGSTRLYPVASAWYALFMAEAAAAIALHLHATWRQRRRRFWVMGALLMGVLALASIEWVGQQRLIDTRWLGLSHLLMPVAFVAMGLHLMREYGRTLQSIEADRQSLEERVREATAQIERNYEQLAELRVEQVTQQERKRIAADLHDDLGAKLLTIVHTSDNDRISTLAREALEEMRLSVRGLTGKPVHLLDALGDWRAEVVSRLAQTGIEAEWSSPVDDTGHTLAARVYVQTTRILREAVNNIIKHSGASRCSVRVALAGGDFQLTIQDNGRGIPMELDGRLDRGHGMSSMKHRAKQMRGQCLVESGPGYGTVIRLTLPLESGATAT